MTKDDLVERRQKYIQRQIRLDKSAVNVEFAENPFTLPWERFLALPQVDDVSDFHCVTTWSRYDNHWRGVRFRTIAEMAVPAEHARFILCTGYDFTPGTYIPYTVNVPLNRAVDDDVLLVHTWEGKPLPREHGGPVRM